MNDNYLYNNRPNFNLTFVELYTPSKAWRLGLGIYSGEDNVQKLRTYRSGDPVIQETQGVLYRAPYLFVGKEFRKYIHEDIFVYTSFDFGLGGGSAQTNNYKIKEAIYGDQKYGTSITGNSNANRMAFYAFARPTLGARINWGAALIGYGISAPYNSTFGSDGFNLNLGFIHEFSIGLKFNQKKVATRKILMIRY